MCLFVFLFFFVFVPKLEQDLDGGTRSCQEVVTEAIKMSAETAFSHLTHENHGTPQGLNTLARKLIRLMTTEVKVG